MGMAGEKGAVREKKEEGNGGVRLWIFTGEAGMLRMVRMLVGRSICGCCDLDVGLFETAGVCF